MELKPVQVMALRHYSVSAQGESLVDDPLNPNVGLSLPEKERVVLHFASLGLLNELNLTEVELERAQDCLKSTFNAHTMPEVINKGILRGMVTVDLDDEKLELDDDKILLLQIIAAGGTPKDVGQIFGYSTKRSAKMIQYSKHALAARNPSNTIKKAYDLRVFKLNVIPVTLEDIKRVNQVKPR